MGNISYYIFLLLITVSCVSRDDSGNNVTNDSLDNLVAVNKIEIDNVIACASASENENEIIAYFYPRTGASDLRYYETENVRVDKNNYANYTKIDLQSEDLFNGYLKKFRRITSEEKWVIICFMEDGILHLSNPIRLKHRTQNTVFSNELTIVETTPLMPIFSWEVLGIPQDAIYFQVVSNVQDELLSGTYTEETNFQYYNTTNVILNITTNDPPSLIPGEEYNFTLMAVSEDNWVNTLIEKPFTVE